MSKEELMRIGRKLASKAGKFNIGLLFLSMCFIMVGCVSWNRGLEPLNPAYGLTWNSKVDTLTPTLRWKAYDDISGKEDIRYQLEILDETAIILSKDDIRETYYTVEAQLDSNKEYQWHVRPIWQAGGKTQRGQWNYRKYFFITPILFGWGSKSYNFTTPEK
jgi:hypothetical protein